MDSFNFQIPNDENNTNDINSCQVDTKIKLAENIYRLDDDNDNISDKIIIYSNNKPTICFATMCKNEEHCIKETLESIYKYIDYWIVSDTGSTDNTCQIIQDFFREKNIPGELHHDEWVSFDSNKTKLFNYCYKKTDYILHLDADDLIEGDFEFKNEDIGKIKYYCLCKRGNNSHITYKVIFMFNNHYKWKFCGVAHTVIKCIDNVNNIGDGYLTDRNFYLNSRDTGNRSNDKDKYYKDALLLKDQFFNTLLDDPENLNSRSAFYTAQSYFDCQKFEDSAKWYSLYIKLKNTWNEEIFESYLRLGLIYRILKYDKNIIIKMYQNAIDLFSDRAEPYLELGTYYNQNRLFKDAYNLLSEAKKITYDKIKNKYLLFVNEKSYGKYINDELSVSCYWIGKYEYSKNLIEEIIDDKDFLECRERLEKNLYYADCKINEMNEVHDINELDSENINSHRIYNIEVSDDLPMVINI